MPPTSLHLERFRLIARGLDAQFRIPGIPVRFGWDAVLGLVPGIGDVSAGVIASYGLYAGYRLGAPAVVLFRMLGNIALDVLVGSVPIAGDLFDISWKGNLRNLALLERWLDQPTLVRRRSRWVFIALGLAAAAIVGATAWLTAAVFRMLLG